MSIRDQAKELSGQAVERVADLGGDDLIANTIIRVAEKRDRVNKLLEEAGCADRISGILVENGIPPKVLFSVSRDSE